MSQLNVRSLQQINYNYESPESWESKLHHRGSPKINRAAGGNSLSTQQRSPLSHDDQCHVSAPTHRKIITFEECLTEDDNK